MCTHQSSKQPMVVAASGAGASNKSKVPYGTDLDVELDGARHCCHTPHRPGSVVHEPMRKSLRIARTDHAGLDLCITRVLDNSRPVGRLSACAGCCLGLPDQAPTQVSAPARGRLLGVKRQVQARTHTGCWVAGSAAIAVHRVAAGGTSSDTAPLSASLCAHPTCLPSLW